MLENISRNDMIVNESILDSIKKMIFGNNVKAGVFFLITSGEKDFQECIKSVNAEDIIVKTENKFYAFMIDKDFVHELESLNDPADKVNAIILFVNNLFSKLCSICTKFKNVKAAVYIAHADFDNQELHFQIGKLSKCQIIEHDKKPKNYEQHLEKIINHMYTITDSEELSIKLKFDSNKPILEINYDPIKLIASQKLDEHINTLKDIIEDLIIQTYFNENDIVYDINPEDNTINETKLYGETINGIDIISLTESKGRRIIPPKIRELIHSRVIRKKMLITCGKDSFLLPEKLKFPVKYPVLDKKGNVKKCEYHCGLIVAAYYRANEWKKKHPEYEKVAQKAKELYQKLNCDKNKELPVKLHINEQIIDDNIGLFTLIELYSRLI